jgi:predicted hydrolase (HD superfamily)
VNYQRAIPRRICSFTKAVEKKAAGCSREVIIKGAEMLGWELEYLIEQTILAMRVSEEEVNQLVVTH